MEPAPTAAVAPAGVRFGPDGLVPAVVTDAASGDVLMVAYMDAEALEATLRTGEVHFHSRSRRRLWRKGETSGNVLRLRSIAADCDADALLLRVDPAGPTCHRGTRSCFDPLPAAGETAPPLFAGERAPTAERPEPATRQPDPAAEAAFAWLAVLWATIAERAAARPPGSYTASLLAGGPEAVGRKVVEEAVEVLLAAKDDAAAAASGRAAADGAPSATRAALAGEAADLLYHLLVLLAERGLSPEEVVGVLQRRHRP
ncbi:MAG TPA: bifunctional phosphoribosyl-AMP cyclohydrolase/phosphoribosyl-ATP diphosphatase HisIE [Candidatus Binatia bacterium]|nr:bifunctional phosphoribosyl-AMP cyclohydrolase/phosphoribosyl-ATP diphosphatase HisIE [Candidatus Binatia bacterium]